MTTIAELFEQEPLRVERGISYLTVWACPSYFEGTRLDPEDIERHAYTKDFCQRIEQVVFYEPYRGDRMQNMVGYRFDGRWVMLCRTAGRPDYTSRQIVDLVAWKDMMSYVESEVLRVEPLDEVEVVSLDMQVGFAFYGNDVRDNHNPSYYL